MIHASERRASDSATSSPLVSSVCFLQDSYPQTSFFFFFFLFFSRSERAPPRVEEAFSKDPAVDL